MIFLNIQQSVKSKCQVSQNETTLYLTYRSCLLLHFTHFFLKGFSHIISPSRDLFIYTSKSQTAITFSPSRPRLPRHHRAERNASSCTPSAFSLGGCSQKDLSCVSHLMSPTRPGWTQRLELSSSHVPSWVVKVALLWKHDPSLYWITSLEWKTTKKNELRDVSVLSFSWLWFHMCDQMTAWWLNIYSVAVFFM